MAQAGCLWRFFCTNLVFSILGCLVFLESFSRIAVVCCCCFGYQFQGCLGRKQNNEKNMRKLPINLDFRNAPCPLEIWIAVHGSRGEHFKPLSSPQSSKSNLKNHKSLSPFVCRRTRKMGEENFPKKSFQIPKKVFPVSKYKPSSQL